MKVLSYIKVKLGFILAVVLAALVGGLGSSIVRASVPDSGGTINACYRTNGGDLRVRDTAITSDTCSNKETAISWKQGGAAVGGNISMVYLNDDGTLDPTNSYGVTGVKLAQIPNPYGSEPANLVRICFNMSQTPKWGTTSGGGYTLVSSSMVPDEAGQINTYCGPGYNAVDGSFRTNPSDGGNPWSSVRYIFWN